MSQNIMLEQQRIYYFDIAKGVGILAVILGHLGWHAVNPYIYSFHMPLFLIISGYFISNKGDAWTFIKRKAQLLLVPFAVVAAAIILFLVTKMLILEGYQPAKGLLKRELLSYSYANTLYCRNIGIIPLTGQWFFLALFWASMLVYSLRKLATWKGLLIVSCIAYIGYYCSPLIALPLCLDLGAFCSFFVYLGFLAKRYGLLTHQPAVAVVLGFICWMISCMMGGDFYFVTNHVGDGIYSILGAIGGVYAIIALAKRIQQVSWLTKLLSFLGEYSLLIYALHCIEMRIFPWGYVGNLMPEHVDTPMTYFILKLLLCIAGTLLYLKIKKLIILLKNTRAVAKHSA